MMLSTQLSYGVAFGALQNQAESGDQYLVKKFPNSVLVVVADGVGHGEEAAYAAKKAMHILNMSEGESLTDLVKRCHVELTETRGMAITLALIHDQYRVSWLGIGNVTVVHWHKTVGAKTKREELLSQGGIVGLRLPPLRVSQITTGPGDTLIFATDGISSKFIAIPPMCHALPQTIADHIFREFRDPKDDALVLVTRWKNAEVRF